jgi:hypothetical protein
MLEQAETFQRAAEQMDPQPPAEPQIFREIADTLPPKADSHRRPGNVRFGPKAGID